MILGALVQRVSRGCSSIPPTYERVCEMRTMRHFYGLNLYTTHTAVSTSSALHQNLLKFKIIHILMVLSEALNTSETLLEDGVWNYSWKIRWTEAEERHVEAAHERTRHIETESFIGDYCRRLMESDNTTTEAGSRRTTVGLKASLQNLNVKLKSISHYLFRTSSFCLFTHLRDILKCFLVTCCCSL